MKAIHGLIGAALMLTGCGKPPAKGDPPVNGEAGESNAPSPEVSKTNAPPQSPNNPTTPAPLAGLYRGEVGGKMSQVRVNADGTLLLHPRLDEPNRRAPGTWEKKGDAIVATFKTPDGDGQAWLRVFGNALVMEKLQTPDGEIEVFAPSLFKRTVTNAGPPHTGTYEGTIDDGEVKVELSANGKAVVSSKDTNSQPLHQGIWKSTPGGVEITVGDKDNQSKAYLRAEGRDLLLYKLEEADGNVENFQPRLERITEE